MQLLRHHFGTYLLWQPLEEFFERRGREGYAENAKEDKRKEQPKGIKN